MRDSVVQASLRLIVGLGNPGLDYSETRHNAGFWFCERLARELGVSFSQESRFHGWAANARSAGAWLLMPGTFMNHSGQAVQALAHFYRILPNEILVVHDELDLPPGQMRLKFGGGLGGHNGLKDINAREFLIMVLLAVSVLFMGLYPKPFTDVMDASVSQLLQHVAASKLN